MSSEPTCVCLMETRTGQIIHNSDCEWKIWKSKGSPELKSTNEYNTGGLIRHDFNVTRLIVKDVIRMASLPNSVLLDSIKRKGILTPITVLDLKNGYYQIVDGVQRFKAVILLGRDSIPGIIVDE